MSQLAISPTSTVNVQPYIFCTLDSEDEEEEGYSSTGYPSSVAMTTTPASSVSTSMGVASSSSGVARWPPVTRSQSGVVVRKKAKVNGVTYSE